MHTAFALLFVGTLQLAFGSQPIALPPLNSTESLPSVGLVWIQGALSPNDRYLPLLTTLQQNCPLRIWVGLPSEPLDTPNPLSLPGSVSTVVKMMEDQGFEADTPMFFGAHSLGTVMVQDYITNTSYNVAGQILGGGYLARKHYYPSFSYPIPTMTIGGELDGLARVTRTVAESLYNIYNGTDPSTSPVPPADWPVIVVSGMNHWQFASGVPSSWVKSHDLQPEISNDTAHTVVADHICTYMQHRLGMVSKSKPLVQRATPAAMKLQDAVQQTADFAAPIIQAYLAEGSRHFNCKNQYGGQGESTCSRGLCSSNCEWSALAQSLVTGDVPGFDKVNVSDHFAKLSANPVTGGDFHLAHVYPDPATRVVTITTFTQGAWERLDAFDGGVAYTSATALSVKMVSRQCSLINGTGNASVPFSVDDPSFCRMANERAYAQALQTAGNTTVARHLSTGQRFVFADDISKLGGPWFLEAKMQFNPVNNNTAVEVASPMMKTEVDYWAKHFPFARPSFIPDPGCFHYCKLLSPARAMEWVYVDSLRAASSHSNDCAVCVEDATKMWCWVDGACYDLNDTTGPCAQDKTKCAAQGTCSCDTCLDPTCAQSSKRE